MSKPSQFETAMVLHSMADAILTLTHHLPEIDPEAIAPHVRAGFENSLTRVHDAIHAYKTRAEAAVYK